MVELLLSKGADVAAKTHSGRTALHCAAQGGHLDVVELLLSKGADSAVKDQGGLTALRRAAGGGHKDVVELLLSEGTTRPRRTSREGRPCTGGEKVTRTWSSYC